MNTATIIGLVITGLSALAGIVVGVLKAINSNRQQQENNGAAAAYGMMGGTNGPTHAQIYAAAHQPNPNVQQRIANNNIQMLNRPMNMTNTTTRCLVSPSPDAIYTTAQRMDVYTYGQQYYQPAQQFKATPTYTQYAVQWSMPTIPTVDHEHVMNTMAAYNEAMSKVRRNRRPQNQPLPEDVIDTVLASAERQYQTHYYGNTQPV